LNENAQIENSALCQKPASFDYITTLKFCKTLNRFDYDKKLLLRTFFKHPGIGCLLHFTKWIWISKLGKCSNVFVSISQTL